MLFFNNNRLVYKRKLKLNDGSYPKAIYDEFVEFFRGVTDADNYSVSLVKAAN
jgi:hypothetical protein